jgi:hypothetical protein
MLLSRFDRTRLRPVEPGEVNSPTCAGSRVIVQACQLGAGPATRPLGQPWVPPRIEWPFGVFHVADAQAARRACLQLDGTWAMADAASGVARLRIRAAALAADAAWWRPLAPADAWDAGVARSVAGLQGFKPRRATLIVVEQAVLSRDELSVLAHMEQQAFSGPRAVRVVLVGGHPPALARPLAA